MQLLRYLLMKSGLFDNCYTASGNEIGKEQQLGKIKYRQICPDCLELNVVDHLF